MSKQDKANDDVESFSDEDALVEAYEEEALNSMADIDKLTAKVQAMKKNKAQNSSQPPLATAEDSTQGVKEDVVPEGPVPIDISSKSKGSKPISNRTGTQQAQGSHGHFANQGNPLAPINKEGRDEKAKANLGGISKSNKKTPKPAPDNQEQLEQERKLAVLGSIKPAAKAVPQKKVDFSQGENGDSYPDDYSVEFDLPKIELPVHAVDVESINHKPPVERAIESVLRTGGAFDTTTMQVHHKDGAPQSFNVKTETGLDVYSDGAKFDLLGTEEQASNEDLDLSLEVRSMIQAAKSMGWTQLDISGTPAFINAAKKEAQSAGVELVTAIVEVPEPKQVAEDLDLENDMLSQQAVESADEIADEIEEDKEASNVHYMNDHTSGPKP